MPRDTPDASVILSELVPLSYTATVSAGASAELFEITCSGP